MTKDTKGGVKKKTQKKSTNTKKNKTIRLKRSVPGIKLKETKYTFLLVIFFMILFAVIGYCTLSFNHILFSNDLNSSVRGLANTSSVVTLTNMNVKHDIDGLKTNGYEFEIINNTNKNIDYKIVLEEDKTLTKKCGCSEEGINFRHIRFSVDGSGVKKFDEDGKMIISTGTLEKNSKKTTTIKLWLDGQMLQEPDGHFHGHFVLEK